MNSEHRYAIELNAHEMAMIIDALENRITMVQSGGKTHLDILRRDLTALWERMKKHQPYIGA
jgi:hypothetical protein